jgi:hypothetical protein
LGALKETRRVEAIAAGSKGSLGQSDTEHFTANGHQPHARFVSGEINDCASMPFSTEK